MLVSVCRGHEGEVTDLSVSGDDSLVASSSNDHSIRCWSLQVRLSNCCSRWMGDEVELVQMTLVRVTPLVWSAFARLSDALQSRQERLAAVSVDGLEMTWRAIRQGADAQHCAA